MRLHVLSSGSGGNAALLRVGDVTVLIDAGLGPRELRARLALAGVGPYGLDHVLVSHAHLDHSRSAGKVARQYRATLHAPESLLRHRACQLASQMATMPVGGTFRIPVPGEGPLEVSTVAIPHDCDPTVAFRFEHRGRVLGFATDLGEARPELARLLRDPHVLFLESNHDPELLAVGPYPAELKRRVAGPRGHLSNAQAAALLPAVVGPRLHTVVLAHLSATNNLPELACEVTRAALRALGREEVAVWAAAQDAPSAEVIV